MAVTNTPDKSEMKATERVANWLATPEGEVEEAPVDAIRELLGLVRSRPPADQVSDMVERLKDELTRQKVPFAHFGSSNNNVVGIYNAPALDLEALARAALQAVPAASEVGWQPIESAPKDGTPLLLAGQYVDHPSVAAFDGREWVGMVDGCAAVRYMSDFGTEYLTVDAPEFWRPLPAPPTLKASGEE